MESGMVTRWKRIAAGSGNGLIRIWDGDFRTPPAVIADNGADVDALAWSLDGRWLAFSDDHTVRMWDATNGIFAWVTQPDSSIMSFAWSPNGQKLTSGSLDGSIRLSDPTNGQELAVLEGHTDPVRCVTFSPGGQVLASSSWDGSVRIWHAETGIPLAVLPQGVSRTANSGGLAFHPKQPIFASSGDDDTVIRIWRLDYVALFEGERAESAR